MRYSIAEYDESKEYNDEDVFVLDDRCKRKYDPETDKIVKIGDLVFDNLPDLNVYEFVKESKNG